MDRFQLPPDLTSLDTDALNALLEEAVARFDQDSQADTITAEDLEALRQLKDDITAIRAEQQARIAAAEEAQAAIDALRSEVHGDEDDDDGDDGGEGDEVGEPEVEAVAEEPADEPEVEEVPANETELVTAASRPLDMREVRRRQPKQRLPEPAVARPVITAAADVPGLAIGQKIDIDRLVDGVTSRARGLHSAKRGAEAMVASYQLPFPDHMVVNDPGSPAEGSRALIAAGDQSRLPGGDLVASGGWCAPSETIYDLADIACPDMLWSAPEVQLRRGGIRFFQTPSLDVGSLTWVHTEAADIGGAEKPCFQIPCPDPVEVRCDAVGVCLEAGILTERHFPELVAWYVRNSMVAHEIRISSTMFLQAIAASEAIVGQESYAAFSAVFGQVALHAADMIEKHSLCDSIAVEVTFPWWARNLFLADIARQNGRRAEDLDPSIINQAFASLGVSVQWSRGLPPGVPTNIGGADPATAWPDSVPFLIHPAGAFQIGRGAEVNLGVVHDSEKFKTNDYTALFTEECVALINRGPESRFVTVPVCPDGTTGPLASSFECPIDAGELVS